MVLKVKLEMPCGLGDLNVTNKTNNLPFLLDRCWEECLMFQNYWQWVNQMACYEGKKKPSKNNNKKLILRITYPKINIVESSKIFSIVHHKIMFLEKNIFENF